MHTLYIILMDAWTRSLLQVVFIPSMYLCIDPLTSSQNHQGHSAQDPDHKHGEETGSQFSQRWLGARGSSKHAHGEWVLGEEAVGGDSEVCEGGHGRGEHLVCEGYEGELE